jgi:hypothetical protein
MQEHQQRAFCKEKGGHLCFVIYLKGHFVSFIQSLVNKEPIDSF